MFCWQRPAAMWESATRARACIPVQHTAPTFLSEPVAGNITKITSRWTTCLVAANSTTVTRTPQNANCGPQRICLPHMLTNTVKQPSGLLHKGKLKDTQQQTSLHKLDTHMPNTERHTGVPHILRPVGLAGTAHTHGPVLVQALLQQPQEREYNDTVSKAQPFIR